MINEQISKKIWIQESTIWYYRRKPNNLFSKRSSKLPKRFIDEIYKLGSNKITREMSPCLISICSLNIISTLYLTFKIQSNLCIDIITISGKYASFISFICYFFLNILGINILIHFYSLKYFSNKFSILKLWE